MPSAISPSLVIADHRFPSVSYMSNISNQFVGLLDLVPGCVAFWRPNQQALASYAGNMVRIRETGGSLEQNFTDLGGAQRLVNKAGIDSFIGINSGAYSIWYDLTGRGNDVTQGTAGNQPTYNGTGGPGGGVAGVFASTSGQLLSRADNADLSSGDVFFTYATAIKFTTITEQAIAAKGNFAGGTREWIMRILATGAVRFEISADGTTTVAATWGSLLTSGVWYSIIGWHDPDANTINIQVNNGTPASQAVVISPVDRAGVFQIGRESGTTNTLNGVVDFGGLWKPGRNLTADERTLIYNEVFF